jgi:hypothetical protein
MKTPLSKKLIPGGILNFPVFFIILPTFILCSISCRQSNILRVESGYRDYCRVKDNYLIVSGTGEQSGKDYPENQKLMARRAAIVDAQRNSLRYLGLARRIKQGSVEYERVEGIVKGAAVVREDWPSPQKVNITLKIPINGQESLSEGMNYERIDIK